MVCELLRQPLNDGPGTGWHAGVCQGLHDDIIIYSQSWEGHMAHVAIVLKQLMKFGLTAKPSKCQWGESSLTFLVTHFWEWGSVNSRPSSHFSKTIHQTHH